MPLQRPPALDTELLARRTNLPSSLQRRLLYRGSESRGRPAVGRRRDAAPAPSSATTAAPQQNPAPASAAPQSRPLHSQAPAQGQGHGRGHGRGRGQGRGRGRGRAQRPQRHAPGSLQPLHSGRPPPSRQSPPPPPSSSPPPLRALLPPPPPPQQHHDWRVQSSPQQPPWQQRRPDPDRQQQQQQQQQGLRQEQRPPGRARPEAPGGRGRHGSGSDSPTDARGRQRAGATDEDTEEEGEGEGELRHVLRPPLLLQPPAAALRSAARPTGKPSWPHPAGSRTDQAVGSGNSAHEGGGGGEGEGEGGGGGGGGGGGEGEGAGGGASPRPRPRPLSEAEAEANAAGAAAAWNWMPYMPYAVARTLERRIAAADSAQAVARLLLHPPDGRGGDPEEGDVEEEDSGAALAGPRPAPRPASVGLHPNPSPRPSPQPWGQRLLRVACRRVSEHLQLRRQGPGQQREPQPEPQQQQLDPVGVLAGEVLRSASAGLLGGAAYCELAGLMGPRRLGWSDPWFWAQLLEAARPDLPSMRPHEIAALLEAATAACCASGPRPDRRPGPGPGPMPSGGVGGSPPTAAGVAVVPVAWLDAAEGRLLECADNIGPADATRLLSALAALRRTPPRPLARLLVAAAGAAFRGWSWSCGTHTAGGVPGGCSGGSSGPRPRPRPHRRVLSEGQLRALLLSVAAVDGAYPGEAWLADWCAAYRQHLDLDVDLDRTPARTQAQSLTHGSAQQLGNPPNGAEAASVRASDKDADEDSDLGPWRAAAVAEILYCLATLQCVPPEPWEAAALAAVQRGLGPWLHLGAHVDPHTWAWAVGPEPQQQQQQEPRLHSAPPPRRYDPLSPEPRSESAPGPERRPERPGWSPDLDKSSQVPPPPPPSPPPPPLPPGPMDVPPLPLPMLTLVQLAWGVGAMAAACPLPPLPPLPGAGLAAADGARGAVSAEAAARATRRRRMWEHRRRVFGAALAAVAAWGMEGTADGAAAWAVTAAATSISVKLGEGAETSAGGMGATATGPRIHADVNVGPVGLKGAEEEEGTGGEEEAAGGDAAAAVAVLGNAAAWAASVRDVLWGLGAAGLLLQLRGCAPDGFGAAAAGWPSGGGVGERGVEWERR